MIQQYLTFAVNNTRYAINVFKIQEVLEYEEPQAIPCSSPLLIGIIRSRDTNIAIMDIRKKFGLDSKIPGSETRTIVLEVVDPDSGVINLFGIVADSVFEVIELDDSHLEPLPKSKDISGGQFVSSVFTQNGLYTLVLDVNKIFSEEEMSTQTSEKEQPAEDTYDEFFQNEIQADQEEKTEKKSRSTTKPKTSRRTK